MTDIMSYKIDLVVLISIDSFVATLPVWDCRSLPARSTNCNALRIVLSGYFPSTHSNVTLSIECERLLELFML